MFRTLSRRRLPNRRGAILLVVLTLLALFAVIGLSFALYAESEATAARIHREGESRTGEAAPDPTDYFNTALMGIIYPIPDTDATLTQSGFRGYELARLMYGYNPYTLGGGGHDLSPFNGLGLFPSGQSLSLTFAGGTTATIDRSQVVSYYYQPGDLFVIDPEWNQFRTNILDPTSFTGGTRTYHSIAAPYTYPDLKDLPLAVFNPTTGMVMQPSYYRTYGSFTSTGGLPAGSTGLEPLNTNWTTPQGRLLVIRPRPFDHLMASDFTAIGTTTPTLAQVQSYVTSNGLFPYPPANADGTYTGDVQNIPNPQGQQRMDAVWIYPAGPVRRWNGKLYTALVAPTVIELNGRVNLSMAGNIKNNKTHASDAGVLQSEINPRWVFDNTATGLTPASQAALLNIIAGTASLQGRYGTASNWPQPDRITTQSMASFNYGLVPPSYGRVDLDGVSTSASSDRANTASTNTSPFPVYANTRYFDSTTQTTELTNHPAQFNPDFWSPIRNQTLSRTFPPFDLLRLATRYGDQWSRYSQADLAQLAPLYLKTASTTGQFTTTDAANLVRMLVTTQSSSLYRPEVQVPTGAATGSPAVAPTARLGPIDLNRPLADYRDLTAAVNQPKPMPLSPNNTGNAAAAQIARQRFARDVFVRLVALSGLFVPSATPDAIYVNDPTQSDYGYIRFDPSQPTFAARLPQFQALAQLAANVVDYIDPDDINTTFTWNPMYASGGTSTFLVNAVGMPNVGTGANQLPPASMGSYVVFGTELPRLVVNEAYGMLTNNQADVGQNTASKPFRMAFWVELVNPLTTPPLTQAQVQAQTGGGDPALSDLGAARLQYQLPPGGTPYPVHQLLIAYPNQGQPGTAFSSALNTTPTNVTGDPSQVANVTSKIQVCNFAAASVPNPATADTTIVLPVQGQPNGSPNGNSGYYVVGPQQQNNQDIFPGGPVPCTLWLADPASPNPQPNVPANSMIYEPGGNSSTDLTGAGGADLLNRKHTVILRRLANPYLPPNDPSWQLNPNDPLVVNNKLTFNSNAAVNPYITVDFIENVPTRDRVTVTGDQGQRGNGAGQDTNPSVGKRHVYGASNGPLGPAYTDNPATVNQAITQQIAAAGATLSPAHTFFAANNPFGDPGTGKGGSLQNAGSLAWMTHLDRQLINPLELVSVAATAPALVTQNFTYWPTGAGALPTYNRHTAESLFLPGLSNGVVSYFGVSPLPQPTATGTSAYSAGFLSRALDLLTVRSFLTGVPVGGREQGKLNINTIWHQALLQALLDSNGGNYFTTNDVTSLWQRLTNTSGTGTYTAARSQWSSTPYNATAADAPIWGLATYDTSLSTATSTNVAYNNLQRTILRSPDGAGGVSNSLLYNPNPANLATTAGDSTHVVGVAEPLRKAWNSTTTTGNTFLVVMTVGYFEVRNPNYQPGDRVFLGKELYKEVPGDLRQKFVSVIDRSNLSLDWTASTGMGYLQGYTNTTNTPLATSSTPPQPWFTTLTADAQQGTTQIVVATDSGGNVYVGGVPVTLTKNQQLWLGFGNGTLSFANNNGDGELVIVNSVAPNPSPSGTAVITLTSPTQRYHPAGSPVSNQLLGNPGPQPSFDYRDRRYQGVVPYCVRVTPTP